MLLSFNPYAFKKFVDLFNPQPPGYYLKLGFPGHESEDGENNNSREERGYWVSDCYQDRVFVAVPTESIIKGYTYTQGKQEHLEQYYVYVYLFNYFILHFIINF